MQNMNNFDVTFKSFEDDKMGKPTGWNGHSLTLLIQHCTNEEMCWGNLVGIETRYRLDDLQGC